MRPTQLRHMVMGMCSFQMAVHEHWDTVASSGETAANWTSLSLATEVPMPGGAEAPTGSGEAVFMRHVIPVLGRMPVKVVRRDDVERFMHDVAAGKTATREKTKPHGLSIVRGGRGVAGRTVALLGAIFSYAVRQGIRLDNPVHGIVKFAEGRRQRRLSNDEYRMLGMALSKSRQEKVWQPAIAATWLMIVTGWRRGEVLGRRWSEVDLPRRTARLADTKTGELIRPLSELACSVIQSQPRIGDIVFASRSGETPIVGYRKMWLRIAKLGGLSADITPHVLRHSFASLAADLGYNEPTIASLLGHKNSQHHQQVHAFRRYRAGGSSRCRGKCHHEADGLGSSANPVAGSAARWISVWDGSPLYRCFRPTRFGGCLMAASDLLRDHPALPA